MAAPMDEEFQPGAAINGNFIDYYSFNPAENRTRNIPKTLFNDLHILNTFPVTCLDVGCNSGELTAELYRHFKSDEKDVNFQFLGVDLDPILIERSIESNKFPSNITFEQLNFMDTEKREKHLTSFLRTHNTTKFDVSFAFSITMWIHINNGDDGLCKFLDAISKNTKFLLIEPQPWKCYRSALRRIKRSKNVQNFTEFSSKLNNLKIRENIEEKIAKYLTEKCKFQQINEFEKTKWRRRILLFKSNHVTN